MSKRLAMIAIAVMPALSRGQSGAAWDCEVWQPSARRAEQFRNGLVAYYSMNNAGDILLDRVGGTTATTTNGVTYKTTGTVVGQAAVLNNTAQAHISMTPIASFSGLNAGTVSVWAKTDVPSDCLFSVGNSKATTDYTQFIIGSTSGAYSNENITVAVVRGNAAKLTGYVLMSTNSAYYIDNVWHHFVFRSGNGDNAIFVDGVRKAVTWTVGNAATAEFSNVNTPNGVRIGSRVYNGLTVPFGGSLDEFRFWNRALSDAEIWQVYAMDKNALRAKGM